MYTETCFCLDSKILKTPSSKPITCSLQVHHFCLVLSLSIVWILSILFITQFRAAQRFYDDLKIYGILLQVFGLSIFSSSIAIIVYVFRHYHISLLSLFPLSKFSCVWFFLSLASSFFPMLILKFPKFTVELFPPPLSLCFPYWHLCWARFTKGNWDKTGRNSIARSKTKCPA